MKKNILFVLLVASMLLTACNDWLDVKPKTQIESSELLKDETGYKDALWGVYMLMSQNSMYGVNMTIAPDVMAKMYSKIGSYSVYTYLNNHDYSSSEAQTLVNTVWQKTYTAVANLNNLIHSIKNADSTSFSRDNYNVIYGEALGLRAFLHFDLLRLFAPSYADDPEAEAIPYVSEFDYNITESSTVSEAVALILKDLEAAAALLKRSDPLATGREITTKDDNGYLLDRKLRFNYYAVVATMARVYLWKGDKANAALKAEEVISNSGCKWVSIDNVAVKVEERDLTFTPEQIFALKIENLESYLEVPLSISAKYTAYNSISVQKENAAKIYPYATDWRGWNTLYWWSDDIGVSSWYEYRMPTKLWQYENMPAEYKCLMPIIRLPEMKLIIAESRPDTEGAGILNEIRSHRGITEQLSPTVTTGEIQQEIQNEYRREFYCEGVLWYYYKRLNVEAIPYYSSGYSYSVAMNRTKYVWPMPDEELEFGNRNQNNK